MNITKFNLDVHFEIAKNLDLNDITNFLILCKNINKISKNQLFQSMIKNKLASRNIFSKVEEWLIKNKYEVSNKIVNTAPEVPMTKKEAKTYNKKVKVYHTNKVSRTPWSKYIEWRNELKKIVFTLNESFGADFDENVDNTIRIYQIKKGNKKYAEFYIQCRE
jgi:uncharacterized membrane-anchored protein YjiN (DUF445 family)